MNTVPLPKGLDMEQGSMMLVNPMTAMAFISLTKEGKHRALVNNAAASSLGKMLIRLARKESIPLINIVRTTQQVEELKKLGASHVLNSSSTSFPEELSTLSDKLGATLILDAVSGKGTGQLLAAAPNASTLVVYARLSGHPIQVNPSDLIRLDKNIIGFQLGNYLSGKSIPYKLKFLGQVKKEMNESLSSLVRRHFPMEEVNEAIALYRDHMSAGKVLLRLKG
jgi:NADPH:quinone reductase-like Zn-dependent oxidoreductase